MLKLNNILANFLRYIFDLYFWILATTGLYRKKVNILLIGLDNSGKSTLFYYLRDGRFPLNCDRTVSHNHEEIIIGSLLWNIFDLAGHEEARRLWLDFYCGGGMDGVVFFVDASDPEKMKNVKIELDKLLDRETSKCPVLILGNKTDKSDTLSEHEIIERLDLRLITTGKQVHHIHIIDLFSQCIIPTNCRPVELFMCSIKKLEGYQKGFDWLSEFLMRVKK